MAMSIMSNKITTGNYICTVLMRKNTRKTKTNFVNNIISSLCRAIKSQYDLNRNRKPLVEIIFLMSHIKISNVNSCCSNDLKWPLGAARCKCA